MSTPAPLQPDPRGPQNRGPELIALASVWAVVVIVMMVARTWSRLKQHHFGIDDWCMLFATLTYVPFAILVIVMAAKGGFQHLYYVDPSQLSNILLLNYLCQLLVTLSECFGKISIAFLLLRILTTADKNKWRKWLLYTIIVVTVAITIVQCLLTFFQCSDPRALWDKADHPNAKCWNPMVEVDIALACSAWYSFVDFFLALFPILIVWKLRLRLKKKVAICVLLGLGTITGILCSIKTAKLYALSQRSDGLWRSSVLYALVASESFLVITLGSVPAIRVLYDKVTGLAVNSKIAISLRRLMSRGSHSKQYGNGDGSKEDNAGDHDNQFSQASYSSKGSKKPKGSKTKMLHPLDIPQSLMNTTNKDTITSIRESDGAESREARSEEGVDRTGREKSSIINSYEMV